MPDIFKETDSELLQKSLRPSDMQQAEKMSRARHQHAVRVLALQLVEGPRVGTAQLTLESGESRGLGASILQ